MRGHEVTEARKLGWERISNGTLLRSMRSCWSYSLSGSFLSAHVFRNPSCSSGI